MSFYSTCCGGCPNSRGCCNGAFNCGCCCKNYFCDDNDCGFNNLFIETLRPIRALNPTVLLSTDIINNNN